MSASSPGPGTSGAGSSSCSSPPEASTLHTMASSTARPSCDSSTRCATADRPGLLYDVADALAHFEVEVHTAKIATLGERVEDAFLVTGKGLSSDAHVLRVERNLLERLQV